MTNADKERKPKYTAGGMQIGAASVPQKLNMEQPSDPVTHF
jgi:hypothetical protein